MFDHGFSDDGWSFVLTGHLKEDKPNSQDCDFTLITVNVNKRNCEMSLKAIWSHWWRQQWCQVYFVPVRQASLPRCSCTCSRSPHLGWPWWCSSRPLAGCRGAATMWSNWTRPTRSVCENEMPAAVWKRTQRTRRRCWSLRLSLSWSLSQRCPMKTEMYTPRTVDGRVRGMGMETGKNTENVFIVN